MMLSVAGRSPVPRIRPPMDRPEDRANIAFAAYLRQLQKAIPYPLKLSQTDWAREAGITSAYLSRILAYGRLLERGSKNRVYRPRATVAIAILRVLQRYHHEPVIEEGLKILGYDPDFYLRGEGAIETADRELTPKEETRLVAERNLIELIRGLSDTRLRMLERIVEGLLKEDE